MSKEFILFAAEKINIVEVFFSNNNKQTYSYMSTDTFETGDFAVVDSPRDGLVVVTIANCTSALEHDLDFTFKLKWIVSKVDLTAYEERKELVKQFNIQVNKIKQTRRKKEMRETLEQDIGAEGVAEMKKLVRL